MGGVYKVVRLVVHDIAGLHTVWPRGKNQNGGHPIKETRNSFEVLTVGVALLRHAHMLPLS